MTMSLRSFREPWAVGLGVAVAAAILLGWDLGRPELWLDESASVVATQRTWPDLWHLFGGDETPLLPFYALLKAFSEALFAAAPSMARHPEVAFRLLPAIAATGAAGVFAAWLARRAGCAVAGSAALVLLCTEGFSRYGQEVRPYAFALLFSVLCTATWWRMALDPRRRWIPVYAFTVVLLVCTHLLSGLLLPAHLLAAAVAVPAGGRWRALSRTVIGIVVGICCAAPFLAVAVHAGGAASTPPATDLDLYVAVDHLFVLAPSGQLVLELMIPALALLGAVDTIHRIGGAGAPIARLAACWTLVPTVLFVVAVSQRHNLLLGRYLLFSLPDGASSPGLACSG